jgi:hypothetical protein
VKLQPVTFLISNYISSDTTPTVAGQGATPGDQITVLDNGNPMGTTTVRPDGGWEFTPTTPLADGLHSLTVTETDPSGVTSAPSDPQTITIDTAPEPEDPQLITGEI